MKKKGGGVIIVTKRRKKNNSVRVVIFVNSRLIGATNYFNFFNLRNRKRIAQ